MPARLGTVLLSLAFLAGVLVTNTSAAGTGKSVFAHPEKYVGKKVVACGYVEYRSEDRNIWKGRANSKTDTMGLALSGPDLSSFDGAKACLTGTVFETGCGAGGNMVCLDTSSSYGLRVTDAAPVANQDTPAAFPTRK